MVRQERGLGRGLDALFSSASMVSDNNIINDVDLTIIKARKNQPRKNFDEDALKELADSIKEHGVLQPVLLRPVGENYEIIAGERRWRAAEIAGMDVIPAIIMELSDEQVAEVSLVENLQRNDLSAIEEGLAYKSLIEQYKYTQELLAERVGKSRTYVTNILRLLNLPEEVILMIERNEISPGHGRALLGLSSKQEQSYYAKMIVKQGLSVRQVEDRIRKKKNKKTEKQETIKAVELIELEEKLQNYFGTKAEVTPMKKGGRIEISYYNEEDLERIIEVLGM